MAESLRVADVELSECQGRYTRQLKEQQDTIAHMQHELDVARAERCAIVGVVLCGLLTTPMCAPPTSGLWWRPSSRPFTAW